MDELPEDIDELTIEKMIVTSIYGLIEAVRRASPATRKNLWPSIRPKLLMIDEEFRKGLVDLVSVSAPERADGSPSDPDAIHFDNNYESADFIREAVIGYLDGHGGQASASAILNHLETLNLGRSRVSLSTTLHRMKEGRKSAPEALLCAVDGRRGRLQLTAAGRRLQKTKSAAA